MHDTIIIHRKNTGFYRKATNAKMAEIAAGANWNANELFKVNGRDWTSTVNMFKGHTNGKSAEEAAFNRLFSAICDISNAGRRPQHDLDTRNNPAARPRPGRPCKTRIAPSTARQKWRAFALPLNDV